ncbi:O-antigen ligase family protein [Pelagibacterium halotolerans]|uniref:O-antigen ligase family protein n=1 Tax=Pelagibacterium halotolerans TaxID=531813 RepID=UPI00385181B8
MTAFGDKNAPLHDRRALGAAYMSGLAQAAFGPLVALWVFSGAFVFIEPSPYEVLFLAVLGLSIFAGLKLDKGTLPLLYVVLAFTPFALIAVFQVKHRDLDKTLLYTLVTIFLMLTSYIVANFVAQVPLRSMRIVGKAYIAAAIVAAVVGTAAYLGFLPGEGALVLYGRARAFFNDPNVYGPFLILPAMFLLQRTLLGTRREALMGAALYLVIFVGVFVSFSRGAWGHMAVSSALVFFLCFFLEAKAHDKVRMLMLAIGGIMVVAALLMALLSIESVAALFAERFALTQSYDSGATGRFGRIGYAFDLALTHPWGLGPLEFSSLRISEQPHNTYINVLHAYGWGGGFAYFVLVIWTLAKGTGTLARRSPNRLLLIPVYATFVPMIILSGIIDTDHWRHWFLVTGLLWGVCAGYRRTDPAQTDGRRALV